MDMHADCVNAGSLGLTPAIEAASAETCMARHSQLLASTRFNELCAMTTAHGSAGRRDVADFEADTDTFESKSWRCCCRWRRWARSLAPWSCSCSSRNPPNPFSRARLPALSLPRTLLWSRHCGGAALEKRYRRASAKRAFGTPEAKTALFRRRIACCQVWYLRTERVFKRSARKQQVARDDPPQPHTTPPCRCRKQRTRQ